MLTTIEGTYRDGQIILLESPKGIPDGRVLVTFLNGDTLAKTHRPMVFGQFPGSVLPTEEDFKIAEWHGEKEFDGLDAG